MKDFVVVLWIVLTSFIVGTEPQLAVTGGFTPIFKLNENIRQDKAKYVLRYLNQSANPCQDFYGFACGNWEKYHDVKTPYSYLQDKIDNDLENIMDEPVTLDDKTAGRQIKEFYKSCISAERNGQQQNMFFSDFIKGNGGFPAVPGSNWLIHHYNYNWQEVIAQLRHRYGIDMLIGLRIDINQLNMNESSIYLDEPSTLIPEELCSAAVTGRVDIRDKDYEPIEKQVAEELKIWLSLKHEEASKLAADVVTFEYDLCTAMKLADQPDSANQSWHPSFERKTLSELTNVFKGGIDFNRFVTSSLGKEVTTPVFMAAPGYFHKLIKTIAEHNTTTVANYIMYRALSVLSFPLDDNPNKRTSYCLKMLKHYFPKILGYMYYKKHASSSAKMEIELLFEKLKDSFRASLRSQWIEERTRHSGINKLADLRLSFPQYEPPQSFSFQVERYQYWKNLVAIMANYQQYQLTRLAAINPPIPWDEVEAHDALLKYRKSHGVIDIGWGFLQAPYFNELYPNSLRYAMMGQLLAEALSSAFDDLSWSTPKVSYWDPKTSQEFLRRYECFRQQFSNYLHNTPQQFGNYTKLRQIIASSGGLNVAFQAYLKWLEYLSPNNDFVMLSKETLPEVNYTNTQLFFISFAQMFCHADRKGKEKEPLSVLHLHTAERYQVNGPLQNYVEFAREFGCAVGSEMNPVDKCRIY